MDMEHSSEMHKANLSKLCRVCIGRITNNTKTKRFYKCSEYVDSIQSCFGVNTALDSPNIHPENICQKCYFIMNTSKRRPLSEDTKHRYKSEAALNNIFWYECAQAENNCKACTMAEIIQKGGRPKKQSKSASSSLPVDTASQNIFSKIDTDMEALDVSYFSLSDNYSESEKSNFTCTICQKVYSLKCVETDCEHIFCSPCLSGIFTHSCSTTVSCPVCKNNVNFDSVHSTGLKFKNMLVATQLKCMICKDNEEYQNVKNHVCAIPGSSLQAFNRDTQKNLNLTTENKTITVDSVLAKPLDAPVDKIDDLLFTNIVKRKLQSERSNILKVKTKGQVRHFLITFQS